VGAAAPSSDAGRGSAEPRRPAFDASRASRVSVTVSAFRERAGGQRRRRAVHVNRLAAARRRPRAWLARGARRRRVIVERRSVAVVTADD
jgi:hypothetical protein